MTATYDPAEVERLVREAREDDARMTPGPWASDHSEAEDGEVWGLDPYKLVAKTGRHPVIGNAQGIANVRNNLRAMADQLEAARAEIAALNRHVEDIGKAQDRAEANEREWHEENVGLRDQVASLTKERDEFRQMYLDAFGTKDAENDAARARIAELEAEVERWKFASRTLADRRGLPSDG